MAIFGQIPLPRPGYEELGQGLESGLGILRSRRESQLLPYQMELAKAQAQEAQRKAMQSQILNTMLSKYFGIQVPGMEQQPVVPGQEGQQIKPTGEIEKKSGMGSLAASLIGLPVSTQVSEGKIYSVSPFGVEEMGKVGETSQEKSQRELQEKKDYQSYLSGLKSGEDIEKQAIKGETLSNTMKEAVDIFKRRPDLTGPTAKFLSWSGFSQDPDVARLVTLFGNIQTEKARLAGERGGAQLIKWAQSVKPDIGKQGIFNLAMLEQGLKDYGFQQNLFKNMYKHKTGKNLYEELGFESPKEEERPTLEKKFKSNKEIKKLTEEGKLSETEGREFAPKTEGKIQQTRKIGNQEYVKINGEWHRRIK